MVVTLYYKVTTVYPRLLPPQTYSFFLFGPRATGKTTWLRHHYPQALSINLLLDEDFMPLLAGPGLLRERVEALPDESWVVVDEVQRLPTLLNEVHELITRHGRRYRYALSGSSARKLRRLDVNLLAGRVIERQMFPLLGSELGADFDLTRALTVGTLPDVYIQREHSVDILRAYVNTYLRQEIQQEALVKDVGPARGPGDPGSLGAARRATTLSPQSHGSAAIPPCGAAHRAHQPTRYGREARAHRPG